MIEANLVMSSEDIDCSSLAVPFSIIDLSLSEINYDSLDDA